jgi:hypothetical protein
VACGSAWPPFRLRTPRPAAPPAAPPVFPPGSKFLSVISKEPTLHGVGISTDEGETWNDGLLLDERAGVSYPDGVQDGGGLIWITYDRDRNGSGEILVAKFREEDVRAGRDVSGMVALKQVVNKLDRPALLPADWDPRRAGEQVLRRLIRVSAPRVRGAHDAEFVCVGERAYVVEHDNDIEPGHGAGPAQYCVLSVVNLKSLTVEKVIPLAKSGQVFDNEPGIRVTSSFINYIDTA